MLIGICARDFRARCLGSWVLVGGGGSEGLTFAHDEGDVCDFISYASCCCLRNGALPCVEVGFWCVLLTDRSHRQSCGPNLRLQGSGVRQQVCGTHE